MMRTLKLAVAGLIMIFGLVGCAQQSPIKVVTFNIRYAAAKDGINAWPNRQALMLKTIQDMSPDLMGCQEVLKVQADFLKQNMPAYAFVGTGRDDGKEKGEYSPILYRTDRFELLESGQFWLSPTPEKVGSKGWDAALPRICTWVHLRDRRSNHTFYYMNSHWDHVGVTARTESGKLIRKMAAEKSQGKEAVIITGDFNSHPDSAAYVHLMSREINDGLTLMDAYRETHPEVVKDEATFHAFKGTVEGEPIDYILHTPQLKATHSEINRVHDGEVFPSDHYPVWAELVWNQKGS